MCESHPVALACYNADIAELLTTGATGILTLHSGDSSVSTLVLSSCGWYTYIFFSCLTNYLNNIFILIRPVVFITIRI